MATVTLRPNGVGAETAINYVEPVATAHWSVVDDAIPGDSDYISCQDGYTDLRDLYTIPDHGIGVGVINSVSIYFRCWSYGAYAGAHAHPSLRTISTTYDGTGIAVTSGGEFNTYSETWNTNPSTTSAWTWAQITALQIGIRLHCIDSAIYCSQVYCVVDYVSSSRIVREAFLDF